MRSLKYPVFTTSARSPTVTRLATAISIASVPLPATMNGCALGATNTSRIRASARPNALANSGSVWLSV